MAMAMGRDCIAFKNRIHVASKRASATVTAAAEEEEDYLFISS